MSIELHMSYEAEVLFLRAPNCGSKGYQYDQICSECGAVRSCYSGVCSSWVKPTIVQALLARRRSRG